MGKLKVCNLSLEVTRRCNMNCEHCLRGDAQNMDADLALIPKIFAGIDDIDTITFTGGEPALNTAYIKAVVDYVIEHKIPVHGCFVATNGKIYSQELVNCVRRLWEKEQSYGDQFISPVKWVLTHADDEEEYSFFNIAVSGDRYHEDILAANMLRYYRCGFFSKMKMQNEKREYILARGRGVSIPGSFDRTITRLSIEESNDEMAVDEVYVSCTGAVVTDCDLPYEDIDSGESVAYLGKVTMKTPLAAILQKEAEKRRCV